MGKRERKFALLASIALLFAGGASARAQRIVPRAKPNKPAIQQPKPTPQERNMLGMPAGWAERLQGMTPEQQERFLNNNERFQALPAFRQQQIRRRLQALNSMSPEQRQTFEERNRVWDQMPADQQRYVRDTLLPEWKNMRPVRRAVILQRLRVLHGLDDSQRAAKLNDEAFLGGLDQNERSMLRDLSNLRVGAPDAPGENN